MTKVDIISGFLGAGKTTFIKKLLSDVWAGEKLVLIENEFGEIGIDGGFLKDAGIEITEMNSGCICCTLVGDFSIALIKVLDEYHPDRVIIEPSEVAAKLSDVASSNRNCKGRCRHRNRWKNHSCRWKDREDVPEQLWRIFRGPGRAYIYNRCQPNSE